MLRGNIGAQSQSEPADMVSNDGRIEGNPEDEVHEDKGAQKLRPCILLQSALQPNHAVTDAMTLQQAPDIGTQEDKEGHASSS